MKIECWDAIVINAQRDAIERSVMQQRRVACIREMKFCPMCVPQLFDGSLDVVPSPVFCRRHAGLVLGAVGLKVERDAQGVAHAKFKPDECQ